MFRIIFATSNKNKIKEIKGIIGEDDFEVIPMSEVGINIDIEETGKTYEENAFIKSDAVYKEIHDRFPKDIIMADDSGLEIDFLNGEPGINSHRYMGKKTSQLEKNKHILELMLGVSENERTAQFRCCIAAILPNTEKLFTEGILKGKIGVKIMGTNGFGYDPIFFLPEKNCYLSEISDEEKNKVSHRGVAIRKMLQKITRGYK